MEHNEGARPFPKYLMKMPSSDLDVWLWLTCFDPPPLMAFIEKVGGFIQGADQSPGGEGRKGGGAANGSAMFKFGTNYGALRMALTAANIPFDEVTPAKWQRGVGVSPKIKGESKSEFKRRLKGRAQQLFPVVVTLHTADALLIAEYGRRLMEGLL